MGTGTYLLHPEVLGRLRDAFAAGPEHGPRDWTSWLGGLCSAGATVLPFVLRGRYVNVNSRDDLNQANAWCAIHVRHAHRQPGLSAGRPRPGGGGGDLEFAPIRRATRWSRRRPPRAGRLGAAHTEGPPGDPSAPRLPGRLAATLGLDAGHRRHAAAGYTDDTFAPRDVDKFLVYLRDADMVIGTRTTRQMIEQGSNMRGIVRAAHVALAKCLQIVWWRFDSRFTDICCVYRALWRSTYAPSGDS